jgi:hypothetical protein
MNQHQYVSEIYRLIGDLDEELIKSLSGMDLPPQVRAVVNALVSAQRMSHAHKKSPTVPSSLDEAKSGYPVESLDQQPNILREEGADISFEPLLQRIHLSITNDQFVALLKRAGLEIRPHAKEARSSIASKAVRALEALPAEKRERVIRFLLKQQPSVNETQGWMDVIRTTR